MQADLRHQQFELFSEVTLKIHQSLQLADILQATVTEVQRVLQADRVLMYHLLPNGTGKTMSEVVLPGHPVLMDLEFPEEVFPQAYHHLYAQGRVRAIANVHDPAFGLADCLVEFVQQFGVKAKLIVPILQPLNVHSLEEAMANRRLWGLLIAHHCRSERQWLPWELEFMQQLATPITLALAQAQHLEHLEATVEARTRQLQEVNRNLQQEIAVCRQTEEALRQREAQLRLITDALPVLIAYVDSQQRYRFNNKAYQDWLGQSPELTYGQHLQKIWGRECYRRMQPRVEAALAGQVITYEDKIRLHESGLRLVEFSYIPHWNTDQTVQGFFELAKDITDCKASERIKDELISFISHELRTPLTALHSALKILATGCMGHLSTDGQKLLAIADQSTDRLLRLVNNVLDLQRIESGAFTMNPRICHAASLIQQAVEVMQPMAQHHGVTLVSQAEEIALWADADGILQTLTNLLSNAIKFSPPGGIVWLTATLLPPSEPLRHQPAHSPTLSSTATTGSVVVFRIRDSGPGIPPDQRERIFERFHQVDASRARKQGGSGLGLAICRKIVEQHNGKIWVESAPDGGSIFTFTVPTLVNIDLNQEKA